MNRTSNPHVSIAKQMADFQKRDAQLSSSFPFHGKNVRGKKELPAKDTPEWKKLLLRNEALAEPRNDERFKNISTMHPCRSSQFAGTLPAIKDAEKRGVGKKRK